MIKSTNDLSTLELINLLSIALASYGFENHIPSDIAAEFFLYIHPDFIRSQGNLEKIKKNGQKANR